ncbi:MAG: MBL fold metallo-hydrolase [Candidatus Zixiibacteriota bacterium]|nr:MAG: MBL fold metallo-hydrolase [candidate division Zixibacteria bacterium]
MANLTFWGATGTTTGSRFLLELYDQKFLIECGMFQGAKEDRLRNWEKFPVKPAAINQVVFTHAHFDHTGYFPKFCREGFKGKAYCTYATKEFCKLLFLDSAHLQEEDARWANKKGFSKHKPAKPLYTTADAEKSIGHLSPLQYGEDLYLDGDIRVKIKDAGHILGSGLVDIKAHTGKKSKKIVFSGDIGRPSRRFLRDPTQVFDVDYLVIESTYGDRLHDNKDIIEELVRVINESVARGGVLVIPSFAIGRTQNLLYVIRELEESGRIPSLPVYIDSPMAIDATEVFENRISDMNIASRLARINGVNIFRPKNLNICTSTEASKAINDVKKDAIIIASSGMVTGGRILHHMLHRLPDEKNTVLFIGYQAKGTRGRTIVEKAESVKIHGRQIPIAAKIESILGFSGHADYNEILAWLTGFNRPPEMTFIVHGEPESSQAMAEHIKSNLGWDVTIPEFGQSFEIDL